VHHFEREVRLIYEHVAVAQVRGYQRQRSMFATMISICLDASPFATRRLAAQLRERRLELAIGLVLRAVAVECFARIRRIRHAAQDVRGLGAACAARYCDSRGYRENAQPLHVRA